MHFIYCTYSAFQLLIDAITGDEGESKRLVSENLEYRMEIEPLICSLGWIKALLSVEFQPFLKSQQSRRNYSDGVLTIILELVPPPLCGIRDHQTPATDWERDFKGRDKLRVKSIP